jgi:inositol 1,4,5-triphosphate receptor type 1
MTSRYDFFAKMLFITIILANLIVIGTVSSANDSTYNTSQFPGEGLMIFLRTMIMIISVFMYLLSVLMTYPMIIFNKIHENQEAGGLHTSGGSEIQGTIKMNNLIESSSKNLGSELQNYKKYIFYILFDFENLINIILCILAILGWYNPFFYAVMMLDILRRSETLKNVLLVITKNKKSLLLTVVLLVIFVYIFGVWGFALLRQYYMESPGDEYQLNTYCDTLFNCVASSLSLGIRAGGGIGDVIFPSVRKDKYYELRLIFDITFFIIVIIIMLNIFFGIIVDTFAELRDARREIEHDIENFCFVCGRPKHEFELRGSGWNQHIQIEHNVWAYLAYILYIRRKPITECDGIEKYVKGKLMQNDITFFPTTALCLETRKEKVKDSKEVLKDDLEGIEMKLKEFLSKIQG